MEPTRNRSWTALAIAGIFLAGAGPAAEAQVDPAAAQNQAPPALISVHFPGGTVAEFAQLLRTTMRPAPANIALSQAAGVMTLPPIDLDAVTLGTALGALQYIAPAGPSDSWTVQMLNEDPPAYAVALMHYPTAQMMGGAPVAPDRMLQVFSIKELIDPPMPAGPTPETVLSAVDLALRMAGPSDGEPPALKFHPDSGLIILDAPPQEVGAIEALLQRMRDDVGRQRDRQERMTRERMDSEIALQAAAAKMESTGARMDFAKQGLDQMLQLQQSGSVAAEDVRRAQMAFVDAKGDRDMAEVEMRAAQARIDRQAGGQPRGGDPGEVEALRAQVSQLTQQVAALQAKIKELESRKK